MYSDTTVWAQKFNLCSLWFNRVIRPLPPLWVLQEIVGFAALGNWWLEVKTNLDFISDYTMGREKKRLHNVLNFIIGLQALFLDIHILLDSNGLCTGLG